MQIYRTVLVEDNPDDKQLLIDFTNGVPFLKTEAVFNDARVALPFLNTYPVELLLLDIHLPGMSGFDLLRALTNPPATILTTSSLADSLEAFEVGAIDYLVKPLRHDRFLRAVNRVLVRQISPESTLQAPPAITLKQGYGLVRLLVGDINYLEAFGAYTKVHLADGQIVVVNHMLTDLQEKLPPTEFVRVHRSFIVAIARISTYAGHYLRVDNLSVPVGRFYLADLRRTLKLEK